MSNIWFTSDTHFGHKNIVRGCSDWADKEKACRPFNTVEEHDLFLLEQLNKHVRANDVLYHLGDFGLGFAWRERFPEMRARINCQTIHLLLGNHDHVFDAQCNKEPYGPRLFTSIRKLFYGKIAGRSMVLCHYAMRTWPWQGHGAIHLYAHSHGNLADDPNALSMDVGVDTKLFGHTRFTPYSAEEVFDIMDNCKRCSAPDHHQPEVVHGR
jgi:calcineurin-like phosphoesterase family protein